jgi:hypothetical protein
MNSDLAILDSQVHTIPHPAEYGAYDSGSVLWFKYHCNESHEY